MSSRQPGDRWDAMICSNLLCFTLRTRAALIPVALGLSACAPVASPQAVPPRFQISAVDARGLAVPASIVPASGLPGPAAGASAGATGPDPPGTAPLAPTLAPTAPPARAAAGGGSGGGSGGPAAYAGQVLDRQGHPVPGATVLFSNGASDQTDADGRFAVTGAGNGLPCTVFADGYATSTLVGADLPAVHHLERLPSADPDFAGDEMTVRGVVAWPETPPLGGLIQYVDDLGGVANPVVTDAEGRFVLRIEARRAGRPNGMVVALAQTGGGQRLIGLSATFQPLDQGEAAVEITAVRADQSVAFAVAAAPGALPVVQHRLEIARGDLRPFVIAKEGTTSGAYDVPPPGALAASLRIAVEAATPDFDARSTVTLDPYALPATPPAFLPLPTLAVDVPAREISFTCPTAATRAHLSLSQAPRPAETFWEAWLEDVSTHRFAADAWPTGATATARLVAYEGAGATTRRVASASQLRLLPAGDWDATFRSSEVLTTFTPS